MGVEKISFCSVERRKSTACSPGPDSGAAFTTRSHPDTRCEPTDEAGGKKNFEINPVTPMDHSRAAKPQAPRCGARTPTGTPCQRRPIRGRKRCRLHGGLSPGAPRGQKNGNFKTGDWTVEAIAERKWLQSLLRSFCKGSE
ncbi:MAG TPA: HGGxSTG domain-containing protein [Xanthobacteraceae bacterium]|nr:HGGxSTG domain-containing protein [Xanthobacteraceae bacterium]